MIRSSDTNVCWNNMPEVADSYESPRLMNSSSRTASSLLSFKIIGCDDSAMDIDDGKVTNVSMENESILACSQQNSTMDLPLSAPSTIARNMILASSTPKENPKGSGGTPKLPFSTSNKENIPPKREFSEWSNDRRILYRTQKMRNLAAPVEPIICKSTYPQEYIAKLEEHRRREISFESHARQSRENVRTENFNVIKSNMMEFLLSILITGWQIFYMTGVIPNDYKTLQALNIAVNGAFAIFFMAPSKVWWFIVVVGLMLYLFSAWLVGVTVSVATFAFVSVLARALASVFQLCFLVSQ